MLAKFTALLSGKAALTALGVVLVGGAATATTVAATTGHLGPIQTPHIGAASATHTPQANDAQGVHAHTVSIQGTLSAVATCSSGSTNTSASITSLTLIDAKVSPEHPEQDDATATKTPGAEGDAAKSDAGMTAVSGPISVVVTKDTRVTGAGVQTLADLCDQLKQRVEAQTTKDANGKYIAWKVTLLGGGQSGNGGNGSGAAQEITLQGTIKSVDLAKSSFTLTTPTGDVTVTVSANTEFQGSVHALAQAKAGAHVTVRGLKQTDGSVAAGKIILEADH
ncbi:MAG TPA: DUF5666 domain-containing protein [Ktedonobacterales bacterium]